MSDGKDWENAFREWIQSNEVYLDVRIPCVGLESRLLDWYRIVFAENGAMPGPLLTELILRTKRRILPHALEVVQADVSLTLGHGLRMALEEGPGDVPGSANNIFLLGNSLLALTEEDAIAEIAEIAQGEMMDMLMRVWPCCHRHNAATYAEIKTGVPVWWCRKGEHALRKIGGDSRE